MFEVPEAKRVRRDEILSTVSSTASSPDIRPADVNTSEAFSKLDKLLAFDTYTIENPKPDDVSHRPQGAEGDAENEEQEFEFRLFSAPKKNPTTATAAQQDGTDGNVGVTTQKLKIRLHSPAPEDVRSEDGRFVVPFRGWQYYFTRPELMQLPVDDEQDRLHETRRREFEDVAVTSAQLYDWARSWETPGCRLPWRVVHLKASDHRVPTQPRASASSTNKKKKKTKPGKKRRIILRTRAAAAGMTEAEKRNKKNREKKIRKRQRERERKAALGITNSSTKDGVSEEE